MICSLQGYRVDGALKSLERLLGALQAGEPPPEDALSSLGREVECGRRIFLAEHDQTVLDALEAARRAFEEIRSTVRGKDLDKRKTAFAIWQSIKAIFPAFRFVQSEGEKMALQPMNFICSDSLRERDIALKEVDECEEAIKRLEASEAYERERAEKLYAECEEAKREKEKYQKAYEALKKKKEDLVSLENSVKEDKAQIKEIKLIMGHKRNPRRGIPIPETAFEAMDSYRKAGLSVKKSAEEVLKDAAKEKKCWRTATVRTLVERYYEWKPRPKIPQKAFEAVESHLKNGMPFEEGTKNVFWEAARKNESWIKVGITVFRKQYREWVVVKMKDELVRQMAYYHEDGMTIGESAAHVLKDAEEDGEPWRFVLGKKALIKLFKQIGDGR